MAKAYNKWDPGANASLVIPPSEGPLVISGGDSRWPLLVRNEIEPALYRNDDWIGFQQELLFEDGAAPATGARVRGFQYMPANVSFTWLDPVNGEPRPDDSADGWWSRFYRYVNMGFRMPLRGLIGSVVDGVLNVDFQVKWGDPVTRAVAATRGAWTGALLAVLNGESAEADFLAYALHGKRQGDASWEHRGSLVDAPIAGYTPATVTDTPWDGVSEGQVRVLITGGPSTWEVKTQYWDTGIPDWKDLSSNVVDLKQYAVPGHEDLFALMGFLFHGATKVFPGSMPADPPVQDTYFQEVSISQFTPFVLDVADWSLRERQEKLWQPDWWLAPLETKTPALDIITWPEGSEKGPTTLREFDTDEELWGVRCAPTTELLMTSIHERKFLAEENTEWKYMIPTWLADNEAPNGADLPFAYVGRYKLSDLASWTGERTLASFGYAGWRATPAATEAGLGLTWRPDNGGELVLRYWDWSAPDWLTLVAPLKAEDYDGRMVSIGFAWSGSPPVPTEELILPRQQLRIVVDGITVATADDCVVCFTGGWYSSIGSGDTSARETFEGLWFGGVTFIEQVTDTDLLNAFDTDDETVFDNPSFEVADPGGRPGEADKWTWNSFQSQGGWADFSAYRQDLAPYRYGREGFEGGWLVGYSWEYADETARLAATGFTEDDVGRMAWQVDINKNFILTNYSPITWVESEAGENQGAVFNLEDAEISAGVFNAGIPNFESTMEIFAIWGRTWDAMTWSGAPWLDSYNLIAPCNDVLGPYSGPTGFDGWYDYLYATNDDPLCVESFDEAWGNDPLSTAGGQTWIPVTAPGAKLSGTAINFPLEIAPNKNKLVLTSDLFGAVFFSLPTLEYADIASLVSDLNAELSTHIPVAAGLTFGYWQKNGEQGLTFGWDGATFSALWVAFAVLESEATTDLREPLGLSSFSPGGNYTGVGIPVWSYPSPPSGIDPDDRVLMDSWSYMEFFITVDSVLGIIPIEYSMVGAVFDTAVPDPTLLERFTLQGWVSPSAQWADDLSALSITPAMFDLGIKSIEMFDAANWPDEPFPA